jgi:L-threonylcarbamoyladenylate synthase
VTNPEASTSNGLVVALTNDASLVWSFVNTSWTAFVDRRSSGHHLTEPELVQMFAEGVLGFVARNERGVPVGSVLMGPGAPGSWDLMKLAVPPPVGQDVGGVLVRAGLARARELGAKSVELAVSLLQPELTRYYARFGFVVDPGGLYLHNPADSPRRPILMRCDLTANVKPPIDVVAEAVRALTSGHLVGLPTETVYGLAALADDPVAVRRVFATKGRPVDHPLIVHVASAKALEKWAIDIPACAYQLAQAFWPGPLTMVLRRHPDVLNEITGGRDTVALRVPDHRLALAVIGSLPRGSGIAAPSANQFGKVSPTTAQHVRSDLGPLLVDGDLILDGGACAIGVESTIIDLTTEVPTILRPGGLSVERIEDELGYSVERVAEGPSRAPGMLEVHYAPMASVRLVPYAHIATLSSVFDSLENKRVGVLAPNDAAAPDNVHRMEAPTDYSGDSLAPILYARLREADVLGLDVLVVVVPPSGGLGWAVADRLQRSAAASG